MDLNDLLAEVEGIGEDQYIPSKAAQSPTAHKKEPVAKGAANPIPEPPKPMSEAKPAQEPQAQAAAAAPKTTAQPSVVPMGAQDMATAAPEHPSVHPGTGAKPTSQPPPPSQQERLQVDQLFGQREAASASDLNSLDMVLDVELELTVELGKARIPLRDLMNIQSGKELALDQYPGEPLEIYVNERLVAYGQALVVDGSLAVKITEIVQGRM